MRVARDPDRLKTMSKYHDRSYAALGDVKTLVASGTGQSRRSHDRERWIDGSI